MPDRLWERWDEVDRLLEAVLDQAPPARRSYLSRASAGDRELGALVGSLLDEHAAGPLAGPGPALLRALGTQPEREPTGPPPGERIGRYRVTGELGRGGMATVHAAERDDGVIRQEVALKLMRRGVDTDELVRRFLAERRVHAGLSHPHIARLLDAGATDDGRPFLVLERVAGEPITRFADARRLAVRDRLALFLQVADAVEFAHRRLVIHRDLKPSNILVDDDGQAKLLDFGIAKLLDPDADIAREPVTRAGVRPLTPEVASPEQLRGDPMTTASDVYQLGVLLHVLLTGRYPFSGRGAELEAAIHGGLRVRPSEVDVDAAGAAARATTPAGLSRALRGDLDAIVEKAMRVDPEERYPSAAALAADVRRWREGQPIAARPRSLGYRLRKLARRHPWLAPVAALAVAVAATFVVTLALHARALERERNQARAQAARADELRGFLVDLFRTADPFAPASQAGRGRDVTVVEALDLGAARARRELADRPLLMAGILSAIAGVYVNLDVRGPGRALLEEAMAIRREHGQARADEQLDDLGALARVVGLDGDRAAAVAQLTVRVALEREKHGPRHPRVADALVELSSQEEVLGQFESSLAHREEAIAILRAAGPDAAAALAEVLGFIATTYRIFDRLDDAEAAAREAVALELERVGDDHVSTAVARVQLAQLLHDRARYADAIALYHRALPVLERALGRRHFITVNSRNNLAVTLVVSGDYAGAEAVQRQLLAIRRELAHDGRSDEVASSLQNLAVSLLRQGRHEEAARLALEAHEMYRQVLPPGHHLVAFPLLTRAEIQLAAGNAAGAERSAREAVGILRAALPTGHFATAVGECRLGAALSRLDRAGEGRPLIEAALAALRGSAQAPRPYVRECEGHLMAAR